MKRIFKDQAKQFYEALRRRGQTWTRTESTLTEWAYVFSDLQDEVWNSKRIQRVLDWWCDQGCGRLYVPMVFKPESFLKKFEDIDDARKRLKGQPILLYDDLITYKIPKSTQQEWVIVSKKIAQQIKFVDDLNHHRIELPKSKTKSKKASRGLTGIEKELLSRTWVVDEDVLWDLLMQDPEEQIGFAKYLDQKRVWRRMDRCFKGSNKPRKSTRRVR